MAARSLSLRCISRGLAYCQIVLVRMAPGSKTKVFWQEPVWVEGKIRIETAQSPYGDVCYRMTATKVGLAAHAPSLAI